MANPYTKNTRNPRQTPVTEVIPGREADMAKNHGGGVSFVLSDINTLRRFLTLGTEGGTYYMSEKDHTIENIQIVEKLVASNAPAVLREVVDITTRGRAMKKAPAIYTLAHLIKRAPNAEDRRAAAMAVPDVCTIGTDILMLAGMLKALGGMGRNTHRAFEQWYLTKTPEQLAFQFLKYQNREGWSHADVLRLFKPNDVERRPVFAWAARGWQPDYHGLLDGPAPEGALRQLWAFEQMKRATDPKQAVRLITDFHLPREAVKTEFLNDRDVWAALLPHMGATALVRNLGKMSSVGLLQPLSDASRLVADKLRSHDWIKKGKLHPLRTLIAQKIYAQGRGDKGSLTWSPVPQVLDALGDAFYAGFSVLEPTGKKHLLALDVSGSMTSRMSDTPLTCHEATAALSMLRARVESQYYVMGFSHEFIDLGITGKMTLPQAMERTHRSNFGSTNCSLPMQWALKNKVDVDVVEIYTDNEVNTSIWGGQNNHPTQALEAYRQKMGRDVRQIVCGMTATGFTIADPKDPKQLDVVGFDAALPEVVNNFVGV